MPLYIFAQYSVCEEIPVIVIKANSLVEARKFLAEKENLEHYSLEVTITPDCEDGIIYSNYLL